MNANEHGPRESRHLPLLERLTGRGAADLWASLSKSTVLVESRLVDGDTPGLRDAVELLVNQVARFCPRIDLFLPNSNPEWASAAVQDASAIDSREGSLFRAVGEADPADYASIVTIGPSRLTHRSHVYLGWDGWHSTAAIESGGLDLAVRGANLFAVAGAATLGAAMVFREIFGLGHRMPIQPPFCWRSLRPAAECAGDPEFIPMLKLPPTLLVGAGAVGAAYTELLARFPSVQGLLAAVDFDRVGDSDLGRMLIARERDAVTGTAKVWLIRDRLKRHHHLRVETFERPIGDANAWLRERGLACPRIAVSALDRLSARVDLQRLLPDVAIEGATDELEFRGFVSQYGSGGACLVCSHAEEVVESTVGEYVADRSRATGLPEGLIAESMMNPSVTLSAEVLRTLPGESVSRLGQHVGKRVCTILQEFAASPAPGGARPHQLVVSFVSVTAALVALLRTYELVHRVPLARETLFQADFLGLFENAHKFSKKARGSCDCVQRRTENDEVRRLTRTVLIAESIEVERDE